MSDTIVLVLIGAIGVAIGFALGIVVAGLRGEGKQAEALREARTDQDLTESARSEVVEARAKPGVADEIKKERTVNAAQPETAQPSASGQEATPLIISQQQPKRPGIKPVDVLAYALRTEVRQPEQPPASIAVQIDEILQEKLAGTALASRGIKLLELPVRGLVFMIGLDRYEEVEAVPDPEVRALIREAVAEWERRQVSL